MKRQDVTGRNNSGGNFIYIIYVYFFNDDYSKSVLFFSLLNHKFNPKNNSEKEIEITSSRTVDLNKEIIPAVKNNAEVKNNFVFIIFPPFSILLIYYCIIN